jgi:hypothetical protein
MIRRTSLYFACQLRDFENHVQIICFAIFSLNIFVKSIYWENNFISKNLSEITCLSFALNENIVVWIIYIWKSFFIQNFRKAIVFTFIICDSLYLARKLRTRHARTIFLRRHVWNIQFISKFTICNHKNSRIISISFMLISINSFLSL